MYIFPETEIIPPRREAALRSTTCAPTSVST